MNDNGIEKVFHPIN